MRFPSSFSAPAVCDAAPAPVHYAAPVTLQYRQWVNASQPAPAVLYRDAIPAVGVTLHLRPADRVHRTCASVGHIAPAPTVSYVPPASAVHVTPTPAMDFIAPTPVVERIQCLSTDACRVTSVANSSCVRRASKIQGEVTAPSSFNGLATSLSHLAAGKSQFCAKMCGPPEHLPNAVLGVGSR